MKSEFDKELARGQLSAANQGTEVSRLCEELEAVGRTKTQLESEKAELEHLVSELRAEHTREIPLRPTPSSHGHSPATPLPVPSFHQRPHGSSISATAAMVWATQKSTCAISEESLEKWPLLEKWLTTQTPPELASGNDNSK
ncbi:hypothetical protein V500_04252 [Pseudogymnoascus sp. VKM F-4518 (FW-2643)]|nr:hypothetical protein V500_04252 [Pseudogymnoascus sp. VKM F-4518 (FW-2643)]